MSMAAGHHHKWLTQAAVCVLGVTAGGIAAPSHADLFSVDVPGLEAFYGGIIGREYEETEFNFGREFVRVDKAWIHVEGNTLDPANLELWGYLEGLSSPAVFTTSLLAFSLDVPLSITKSVSESILDGNGTAGLRLIIHECCDWQAHVTDATLWFDAIPLPAPTNLREFARFQACFGGEGIGPSEFCDPLDYDRDDDVDLDDYNIFRMAFTGPK